MSLLLANNYLDPAATVAERAGVSVGASSNVLGITNMIVGAVVSVLGVIFFILLIYAGILWMTAAGNSDQVKKAKDILRDAVLGLIITLSSYAIAKTVLYYLSNQIY